MSKKEFDLFVQHSNQEKNEFPPSFWEEQKSEWLNHLDDLYWKIQSFLAAYLENHSIELEYQPITLEEENIGIYETRQMLIKIGQQKVSVVPVGTLLIGMRGRVDITGKMGAARLVLVDKNSDAPKITVTISSGDTLPPANEKIARTIAWTWKIFSPPPHIQYLELNEESFLDLLLKVANGCES